MGRHEDAIIAAKADITSLPFSPPPCIQAHAAIGRCCAKLGRTEEAEEAFKAAISEAVDCKLPFLEMFARRDYIVHVLDGAGRRESQLAPLGRAISRMVMPAVEYTAMLGSGLDAEAAVAASNAQEGGS